jgi:hypothetical protein
MIKSTIYFEPNQIAALEALAKQEGRPKAEIIRDAVDLYVSKSGRKLPSWIGIIKDDDGTLTSDNVDEWLQANWRPE